VPISLRAAAFRTALERVLDEPVHLLAVERGIRVHVTAPDQSDTKTWRSLITALQTADRWGSSDTSDAPEVWAEIHNEEST